MNEKPTPYRARNLDATGQAAAVLFSQGATEVLIIDAAKGAVVEADVVSRLCDLIHDNVRHAEQATCHSLLDDAIIAGLLPAPPPKIEKPSQPEALEAKHFVDSPAYALRDDLKALATRITAIESKIERITP